MAGNVPEPTVDQRTSDTYPSSDSTHPSQMRTSFEVSHVAWRTRFGLVVLGLSLLSLMLLARTMQPSETGLGTHEQLGLPQCSVRLLFGIRCPTCGMTTSWAYLFQGSLWRSLQANCGGTLLAITAIVAAPACLMIGWTGRTTRFGWLSQFSLIGMILGLVAALLEWIFRLW